MQKTKLILKAKAHGAYNKAKKVYMAKVKQQEYALGAERVSERVRHERAVLRGLSDALQALRRALVGATKQDGLASSLGAVAACLSRGAPHAADTPSVQFALDTMAASLEGAAESLTLGGAVYEVTIPGVVDGFINAGYAEAMATLGTYDRCAKQVSEADTALAHLKAQPKVDVGAVHRQEEVLQHYLHDLDTLEDRAYDTVFRVNEEAQATLLRCVSLFLAAFAQSLAAAAATMNEAIDALATEKAASADLGELQLPVAAAAVSRAPVPTRSEPVLVAVKTPAPSRGSVPPPPPARAATPPTSPYGAPTASVNPYASSAPSPLRSSVKASAAAWDSSEGESALDALVAHEEVQAPPKLRPKSASFLQPASAQPLGQPVAVSVPAVAASTTSSSPSVARAVSQPGGRQRMSKTVTQSVVELKAYSGPVYRALAPAESPSRPVTAREFSVRAGKRVALLSVTDGRVLVDGAATAPLLTHHKSLKHPLRLVITTERGKEKFEFNSFEERERCWELLWQLRGIPQQDAVTVYATTFNLGEARMPDTLHAWLPEGYDVYAVGVQECEYIPHRQFNSVEADLFDAVSRHLGEGYCKVAGLSLLSIRLLIMVRRNFLPFVTNVKMHRVPCGHLGKVGNKGAAAVAMHVLSTRLCFVTAHLAAHDDKFEERNADLVAIAQGLRQLVPQGHGPYNHFHGCFLLGDLNYRIDLPRTEVLTYLEQGDAALLLPRDQLVRAMRDGQALVGFQEAPISFAPTYRCWRGREGYSDEKLRVPSWTDRVLWRTLPAARVRVGAYSSCPAVLTSDHRPVFAAFQVGLFKPNLPHGRLRCAISIVSLVGELPGYARVPTTVAALSWSLLDPNMVYESQPSWNGRWGDTIPTLQPVSHNPSYVSARHLVLCVKAEAGRPVATGVVPLAPAMSESYAFQTPLLDERGLFAGTLSGVVAVKFTPLRGGE